MTGQPELASATPTFPGTKRVANQLGALDDQLREEGTRSVIRFRATDDTAHAREGIEAKVREKMEEIFASEPHPPIDPASLLEDKIAHLPPSSVSIKQGPQHADLINYEPNPEHPEQFAPGEFLAIWQRFKTALKYPFIHATGAMVVVAVRRGDLGKFVMPSELGLEDELLSDLANEINLNMPVRLQTLFIALNTSGKFKSQLKIDSTIAESARVILV